MNDEKTINTLVNIAEYCTKIEAARTKFTPTRNEFDEESFYRDGIAFYVQQIGELVKDLPETFTGKYDQIPWHQIQGFRNIIAHAYGSVDPDILWETITEDIPDPPKMGRKKTHNRKNVAKSTPLPCESRSRRDCFDG